MILQVRRWLPKRKIVVVADGAFAALELLDALTNYVIMITRLRLDAGLYEPAPKRKPKQNGRPRKKGERLPTLKQLLESKATVWHTVTVKNWYGETDRSVEICSDTSVWYHTGITLVCQLSLFGGC
jgi:hypothetical protein